MKYEILKYLLEHKEDSDGGFTAFLRNSFPTSTRRLVRDTLSELSTDGLIAGDKNALIQVFMPREDLGKSMGDFPGNVVAWRITTSGERQYFEDGFRNQMAQVNNASIQASRSTVEVNASIKLLNENVIPKFNRFQKRATVVTLIVAILSLIAIGESAYFASKGVTSDDIKLLKQQMEKDSSLLDRLAKYEMGIDSSLRRMSSDTVRKKATKIGPPETK